MVYRQRLAIDAIGKKALFLEQWGVRNSDRIATSLPTGPELVEWLLASLKIGAVFCPLNVRLPPAAIEEQLQQLSPKVFVSPTGITPRASFHSPLPPSSFLLFTSGSMGKPKIVSLSLQSFLASAKAMNSACDLKPGDGWLLSLPLHHVAGLSIVFRCLTAGANLLFEEKDRSITHLSYVTAQLYKSWPIYPKLRCLLLGGGPIHEIPERLPCYVSYGMTETASTVLLGRTPNALRPLSGKEVKLAPDGELLVRGDSLFNGYWNGETIELPLDAQKWFATKDLATFDPKLGFAIVGRKDNQFISGGENIQPEEIEQALLQLPGVVEAIVGPRKHDRFGMRPIALIKMNQGPIPATWIQQELAKTLPKIKIPDAFFDLPEPYSSSLKKDRKKMFPLSEF
jgi:o-succinylbenzoate---CoA ligase